VLAVSTQASVDHWRVTIKADDGAGQLAGVALQVGVSTSATDGPDLNLAPVIDHEAAYAPDVTNTSRWVISDMGDGRTYERDIRSPKSPYDYPNGRKVWNLRVAALPNASNDPIRLLFRTTSAIPTSVDQLGRPVVWELEMINNLGMAGAPANGTIWRIPIPADVPSATVFWAMDTAADVNGVVWGNLPIVKLTTPTDASMLSQGYRMQFRVSAVPEPSSLLALGAGLMSLAGIIRRRA